MIAWSVIRRVVRNHSRAWIAALACGWISGRGVPVDAAEVDFIREIQPILAEHCWSCHGADAASREAGLRLDLREHALAGGDSGVAAIVPSRPEESELMRRVSSADPELVMPPPSADKPLRPAQLTRLKQWIAEDARYAGHWAFEPPRQLPLPTTGATHPIDAWVTAKLHARSLDAAPQADEAILCRRLYLDLIGLPPSPSELVDFAHDGLPATVDKLLASERYGEKWARHWLDLARYSDTNGYEKDLRRDQWAWRDWVVDAFNRDLPYDQFVIEQIAGDLLPGATQSQIVATGFLRNSMLNEEGAIVAEQFRMVEMFDRMDCLGKAVLGLTTQCAQCHSHKFDPLTQTEYYGMFAFLNNCYEAQSAVDTAEQQQQRTELRRQIADAEARWRSQRPQWASELAAWEQSVLAQEANWTAWDPLELDSVSGLNHPTKLADQSILMLGHRSNDIFVIAQPDVSGVTGLRLEVLTHDDLPLRGPGRSPTGTWSISALEVWAQRPQTDTWEPLKLKDATADFSEPEQKSADEKRLTGPVALLIDGSDTTAWKADRGPGRRNQPSSAVVRFEAPLDLPAGTRLKLVLRMDEMVGCCRISMTKDAEPSAAPIDFLACQTLHRPVAERTPEQQAVVFAAWRQSLPEAAAISQEIAALWQRDPVSLTTVLHLREREPEDRRVTPLLDRGQWDRPLQPIEPHTPAFLHPLPAGAPANRLTFARWLASEHSPLTARVAVNRVWQAIFGEGLVETPEDFGTRAPVPEHLELLDWLAVDLMRHQWSQKHLIRMIVSSQAYQRSSVANAVQVELDPRNRWLTRGPRFRADAEVVRDLALTSAGLISHRLGGPPVIPPVPQNVLDYNFVYPEYWTAASGADRYRRTLYGFRKRSMPDPVMTNLDAPNGDLSCARRVRSNTPLAALTSLNEPIFFEAAQAMALRVLREAGPSERERVDYAFRLCTARWPQPQEAEELLRLLESRRQRLAEGWLNPRELTTGNAAKLPELPAGTSPQDAAAWTLVSRVLLNLDETLSKN